MSPVISIQKISKIHGGRSLFKDLSLVIEEKERISLIGPNGAGKSTLLEIVAGLQETDEGGMNSHQACQSTTI